MKRKQPIETKADDGIERYMLYFPTENLVLEGVIDARNKFDEFVDVAQYAEDLKNVLVDKYGALSSEDQESYAFYTHLEKLGIKSIPINLTLQPEFKKYIKKKPK